VASHYRCERSADRALLPSRPAEPTLFCDSPAGGGEDSPSFAWAAETPKSFVPQFVRMRILTADSIAIETLETRLRDAVVGARSQIVGPAQFWGWARV
jgi:hypothetical protein